MEYKVKVNVDQKTYKETIDANSEHDAVLKYLKSSEKFLGFNLISYLISGAVTWTVEPVRAWSIRNADDPQVLATGEFELDKYGNFVINFPPLDVGEYRLSYGGVNIPMKVSEKSDENL